jgi:hypothetical protein
MKTPLMIILVVVAVIIIFAVYRIGIVRSQKRRLNDKRFERIKELYDKIESGETLTESDVFPFAENILTREITYQLLSEHNKIYLFPKEYYSIVKGAESNLANWLEYPTELDACPDEIEHVKRITLDFDGQNNFVHYEVFKYKVNEPHWAANDGWILGVVGPYFDDSKPYDFPHATFSRISSRLGEVTAEEEASWVHENISKR